MASETETPTTADEAQERFHAAFREERRLRTEHGIAVRLLNKAKAEYAALLKGEFAERMAGGV